MRRPSRSDINYRPYLHTLPCEDSIDQIFNTDPIYMLPREDSVNQIYNTDPIYIYYPWEDSVNQIYNTDPILICYQEKTQSIRYTIPTLSNTAMTPSAFAIFASIEKRELRNSVGAFVGIAIVWILSFVTKSFNVNNNTHATTAQTQSGLTFSWL